MTQNLKIRACFMQNFIDVDMKKKFKSQNWYLWSEDQKLVWGNLGPKDISSHKSRNLAPIFTNKTLLSPESDESNKIMKSQKISSA